MEGGGGSWRAHLPWRSRQRVVRRIFEVLERSFPADLTEGLIDLQRVAERLEWRIYSVACDQNEYLRRISLRILYFSSESPLLLEPRPTQMALPSNELSHRREVDHSDTEEDLLDRDRPRSHKKLCEDDRLSDLPDSMLHHIMSFLSAKEAARTCVLSQRWRLLWTSAPCLDISIDQFGNDRVRFSKFVEHLLQSRAPASLDTFCLHTCALDRACNWIDHAIKHNVRVLEFTEDARWEPLYLDPQCLAFSSEFLTCLKLTNVALDGSVFDPLSRTCPSLETLQLIGSFSEVSEISSNSLKRLDIIDCFFSKDLMIRTPNLISLCFESPQCKCAWFNDPSKTTAAITLCDISSAKIIELSSSMIQVRFSKELLRCMFNNLKNLSLGEWCLSDNFSPLVYFLQHSPRLEKLTLKLKSDNGVGIDTICLHERSFSSDLLKKATIFCTEGDARVSVLMTMLRANAKSLEEVDIIHY